ncbi:MAG: hypothetical protein JWN92_2500 [Candidatus Acidoferrum typicum]|nr:hypothetical protein [Candidatus Acidoferrum typicum]
MRVFATMLLTMSLAAGPLLANDAKDAGKEESPATAAAAKAKEAVKPENAVIESELQDLRDLIQSQMQELEAQRAALKAQQLKMEVLEEKLHSTPPEPVSVPVAAPAATPEATPAVAIGAAPRTLSASVAMPAQGAAEEKPSPLYFKIGAAEFYPLGFMDLTSITRTTQLGGIGTNFGAIAFNNTVAGRLTEERLSAQNSRIGLRTHAKFGEADVTGYLEADFLGFLPPNGHDTSNSDSLRLRLYWVDYKRGKFEVLGGQSWSFLTPNRTGLGALPGDLFYSQDVDTNYQLGLTWARQAGVRFIVHPSNNVAIGVALENPEQTLPSSVIVPAAAGAGYASQFDSNSSNTSSPTGVNNPNTPNLHPDIIPKIAFDFKPGGHQVHFDVAGLFRTFKAVNVIATPGALTTPPAVTSGGTVDTVIHGGGGAATMNVELVKNFRIIATGFYSYGGGRYIASTAGPDVIVRPNGTLSGVRSGSGIGGFEWQPNAKTVIYGYYSGAYFGKNFDQTGTTFTGYGFPGSPNTANRYIYEPTFGLHYTMWRNPNYGDIRIMTQFSYVSRTPWNIGSGPATAHMGMAYINLRYDLP